MSKPQRDQVTFHLLPKWRNWQTRQVQDLVPVKGVEVRVLSSALDNKRVYANSA